MVDDLEQRRVMAEVLLDFTRIRHATERRVGELLAQAELDVTPAQANVLMILVQHRKPMTARQLAAAMELSEVTVGRFVRALEGGAWVERERDPSDSRAILVRPTTSARAALGRFIAVSNALQDAAFAGFSAEDLKRVAACTARVRGNLTSADPCEDPTGAPLADGL